MVTQIKIRRSCGDCSEGMVATLESKRYWEAQKDSGLSTHEWIKQNPEEFEEEIACTVCAGTSWVEYWVDITISRLDGRLSAANSFSWDSRCVDIRV